jgi:uncharacterized protein YegL
VNKRLQDFKGKQARGFWLSQLCEEYYKQYSRDPDAEWPSSTHADADQNLRLFLAQSLQYNCGKRIQQHAAYLFPSIKGLSSNLCGPKNAVWWPYGPEHKFDDKRKEWTPPEKDVVILIDVSKSMIYVPNADGMKSHQITVKVPEGTKDKFAAEAEDENGNPRTYNCTVPEGADWSGQMRTFFFIIGHAESKLDTCKASVEMLVRDNIEENDRVGLISFSDDWKIDWPFAKKNDQHEAILRSIRGLEVRGQTAFYASIKKAIDELTSDQADRNSDPETAYCQKWLIALTDGADDKSKQSDIEDACRKLRDPKERLNMALITIEDKSDKVDEAALSKYKEAVGKGGQTFLHVKAVDTDEINKAFAQIGATMIAPTSGAAG